MQKRLGRFWLFIKTHPSIAVSVLTMVALLAIGNYELFNGSELLGYVYLILAIQVTQLIIIRLLMEGHELMFDRVKDLYELTMSLVKVVDNSISLIVELNKTMETMAGQKETISHEGPYVIRKVLAGEKRKPGRPRKTSK